jgi:glycosyltransferase involved in cell wall biosynthesis
MNILMLSYEYPPLGGGGSPVCQELSEFYVRQGHDVEVVTMRFRGLPAFEELNGVKITRVPAWRRRQETCETLEMLSYVVSALPQVIRRLQQQRFEVIHCHFIIPTGLLAYAVTRWYRIPYLLTIHGTDVPGFNMDRFLVAHKFTPPLLRLILRNAAQIVVPSRYLGGLVQQVLGPFDVAHVPNGIQRSKFVVRPKKRRILMTGRLLPRKGFQYVLQALQNLDTDFEAHLVGDGPMRSELEAMAAKLQTKVIFHGWLDHGSPLLKDLYETSSIFCLPSERENASLSLLEAMLAGMAVVTSNVSGCPETVSDTGFIIPPRNPDALSKVLEQLLDSEEMCRAYGLRARRRAESLFDWEKIGTVYLDHLQAIAGYNTR